MTESEQLKLFHASLDRMMADSSFQDVFYDTFFGSSDAIAPLFANSDMQRQKRKLKTALRIITKQVDHEPGVDMYLQHLARLHEGYKIPKVMYKLWLDALINTASTCDPQFSPELETIWRNMIQPAVDVMSNPVDRSDSMASL